MPDAASWAIGASVSALFATLAAIISIIRAMIAPLNIRMDTLDQHQRDGEARARAELDKSERGLRDLTVRAEGIIRQTVEDVDDKLRREAQLIEEKAKIQFEEIRQQLMVLRKRIELHDKDGTTNS